MHLLSYGIILLGISAFQSKATETIQSDSSPRSDSNYWELTNTDLEHLLSLLEGNALPMVGNENSSPKPKRKTTTPKTSSTSTSTTTPRTTTIRKVDSTLKDALQVDVTTKRPIFSASWKPIATTTARPVYFRKETTTVPKYERRSDVNITQPISEAKNASKKLEESQSTTPSDSMGGQLALINKLIASLGNVEKLLTTTTTTTEQPKVDALAEATAALLGFDPNAPKPSAQTNVVNSVTQNPEAQELALLNALFGGTKEVDLKSLLATESDSIIPAKSDAPSSATTVAPGQKAEIDALTNLLLTGKNQDTASKGSQNSQGASANQLASLLGLLGGLDSLGKSNNPNLLAVLGGAQASDPSSKDSANILASLLAQEHEAQASSNNIFSSLLAGPSTVAGQNQNLDISQLFAAQNSPGKSSFPGLGLLSTMTSLGSTLFSTISNAILGGGGSGKPRIRGKGIDTRLGLGYRFGDAADAQVMWEIGPQLYTQPLKREYSTKRHYTESNQIAQRRVGNNRKGPNFDTLIKLHRLQNAFLQRSRQSLNDKARSTPFSIPKYISPRNQASFPFSSTKHLQRMIPTSSYFSSTLKRDYAPSRDKRSSLFMKRSLSPYSLPSMSQKAFVHDWSHSTLTEYEKKLVGLVSSEEKNPESSTSRKELDDYDSSGQESILWSEEQTSHSSKESNVNGVRPEGTFENSGMEKEGREYSTIMAYRKKYDDWQPTTTESPNYLNRAMSYAPMRMRPGDVYERKLITSRGYKDTRPRAFRQAALPRSRLLERKIEEDEGFRPKSRSWNPFRGGFLSRIFSPKLKEKKSHRRKWNEKKHNENPHLKNFKNVNNDLMMDSSMTYDNYDVHDLPQKNRKNDEAYYSTILPLKDSYKVSIAASEDSFYRRNKIKTAETQVNKEKVRESDNRSSGENSAEYESSSEVSKVEKVDREDINAVKTVKKVVTAIKGLLSSSEESEEENPKPKKIIHSYTKLKIPDFSKLKSAIRSATKSVKISNRPNPQYRFKQQSSNIVKSKLKFKDGKPIIYMERPVKQYSTDSEEPIVHVGDDMSLEDLNDMFGKEVRSKMPVVIRGKDKTQKEKDLLLATHDEMEAKQPLRLYSDDDEEIPIFVDIESGEVSVLKPVAKLDSFEPKDELEDELLDADGDGIPDIHFERETKIFEQLQKDLVNSYTKMEEAKKKLEEKKRRKEALRQEGMDEAVDMVSKYFELEDPLDIEPRTEKPLYTLYTRTDKPTPKPTEKSSSWFNPWKFSLFG